MARSRGTAPSRPRPWSLPGIRTRRQLPRSPVPRPPRTSGRRSWADRLGPGPDGPDHLRDACLDGPADAGDEAHRLASERPKAEPGADDGEDLEGTVAVDLLPVRGRDP